MKQRTEITSPSGVRIRMEQEQREFALSRDEVMFLTQVPTVYLLDELISRLGSELGFRDLRSVLIHRAVNNMGSQARAARSLGISSRTVNYWVKERPRKLLAAGESCGLQDDRG